MNRPFNEILKENNYPFAWYVQREPRKLIIGPKGFGDGKDWHELGLVTCGVGYSIETDNATGEQAHYALMCEGMTLAAKLGLKFTFADVENKIPALK